MLFSEPKIPQSSPRAAGCRALPEFQCSSASRKFLNSGIDTNFFRTEDISVLFSEPKIPQSPHSSARLQTAGRFQCSSASRKFLNACGKCCCATRRPANFSALQRAENSSMMRCLKSRATSVKISVLFSEPKIPQCVGDAAYRSSASEISVLFSEPKIPQSFFLPPICIAAEISVLFSEPKIPQFSARSPRRAVSWHFSALQRAENSSIPPSVQQ